MKSLLKIIVISALSIGVVVGQNLPLKSNLKAWLIKHDKGGKEIWVPADSAKPGDIIEYELTYNNVSDKPVKNLVPEMPIPSGTVYIKNSAKSTISSVIEFSIDGGKTFHSPPIYYYKKGPNGKKIKKKATPDMYTNIRWRLLRDLKPGEKVKLTYRVRVK